MPTPEEEAAGSRELDALVARSDSLDLRQYVADLEAGRYKVTSWDMDIFQDEFIRRVKNGYCGEIMRKEC